MGGNKLLISDFNISGEPIPQEIADKILQYHLLPMEKVKKELGINIYPSLKSGYRSLKWEKKKGRSGNSQHTFKAEGATDWTCDDFEENKSALLTAMINLTEYKRFCFYNSFIHADYAGLDRWVFNNTANGWERQYQI